MTEQIKVAKAWGHRSSPSALLHHAGRESAMFNVPYVIVHGLTEAEVHEAAALLAKSREVCEWRPRHAKGFGLYFSKCEGDYMDSEHPTFCPSCGRKVEVKE